MDPLEMLGAAASRLAQHAATCKDETTKTGTGDAAIAIRRAVLALESKAAAAAEKAFARG